MELTIQKKKGGKSKIAALLRRNYNKIPTNMVITISDNAPESIKTTGRLPKSVGWRTITQAPLKTNNKKDYVKFLSRTVYREVWIRTASIGGRSTIYVR